MTEESADWSMELESVLGFLGQEVRLLRHERGLTQSELADLAYATQAMVSYVECAKRPPSVDLVRGFDKAFETGGMFERLLPYALKHAYPVWAAPFTRLEREARAVTTFHNCLVPSLLQTEEYAAALLAAGRHDGAERLLAARLERQRIFDREDPPRTWFVIDEWALRRTVGSGEVMRAQCDRLLGLGRDPRTVIQVLPAGNAEHPCPSGPFALLELDEGVRVLYVDGFPAGRLSAEDGEIEGARRRLDLLRAAAAPPGESAEIIRRYA